ncbi:MAG TPA: acetate uptake transporter [Candidatus Binataceae bacterium]|nr:acetate uptake transporter [Candidatus Binataceae bacterium]
MLTPGKDKGIANPFPLGLACLGITTFLLGFAVLFQSPTGWMPYFGEAVLIGGVGELLAGMWSFAYGNTMGATLFSYVGVLYAWFGLINAPNLAAFGMLSSSATIRASASISIGMVLLVSGVIIAYLWVASFAESATLNGTLLFLWLSWVLLGIAHFGPYGLVGIAGGAAAILSSLGAAYGSFAEAFNEAYRSEVMPVGLIPSVRDRAENEEYERIRRLHAEGLRAGPTPSTIQPHTDLHA